jgi:hypothetical protein
MLENIFNIYDDDGDDALNEEEFISFISDILYISVLMNRMLEKEYHYDNVCRIAKWCSSNFETNLFRIPLSKISHDLFIDGIVYALTENRNLPLYNEQRIVGVSFVPELFHYVHYYIMVAKRRGWPIEMETTRHIVVEQHRVFEIGAPICITNQRHFIEYQEFLKNQPIVEIVHEPRLTPEQQLLEYQERRRMRYNAEREIIERAEREKEEERQRIIRERHEIEDRANREIYEHQQYLEEEQRRREQRNLEEENQQRQQIVLQMQLQQIDHVQEALRQCTRNNQFNEGIDQFENNTTLDLEHIDGLTISQEDEGYDPIEGNINIVEFIKQDPIDHVAFKCGEGYYLASKDRIKSMIQLENSENALFYGCACELFGDWTQIETWTLLEPTVIVDPVYYNIQQLGLPIRYVYLNDIKKVLISKYQYFKVERPEHFQIIPSFASDNVLNHGIGSTSGSHCQDGQADGIYKIKSFDPKIM